MRILSDQFEAPWPTVLTMTALILNSVPRTQLLNHSPHFIVFGQEPFGNDDFKSVNEQFLDINDFVNQSLNNKIYIKLIREFLLLKRIKKNTSVNRTYKSFPKNSLIFVKDMRPRIYRKAKPVYLKIPEKVITEYNTLVYSMDIFGRVAKRSKNNIKMASDRSLRLFNNLPDDIKLILGDVFNLEEWEKIKETGNVPLYLLDIEISSVPIELRKGNIPNDTHLLEQTNLPKETLQDESTNLELEVLDSLNEGEFLDQLNTLHNNGNLIDDSLGIQDVPKLYRNIDNIPTIDNLPNNIPVSESHDTTPLNPVNANIDTRNIISGKRDRHVRFNL